MTARAALAVLLAASGAARAEPPAPAKLSPLAEAVIGGVVLAAGAVMLVGAVATSGDEDGRKATAVCDFTLAALSPLSGAGAISLAAGSASLGVYNLVNHQRPATRRWVNGVGLGLTFAAATLERRIELGSWKDRRLVLSGSARSVELNLRF